MKRILRLTFVSFALSLLAMPFAPAFGAEPTIDFARQILPILSNKCFVCHGPDTQDENELRLDSYEDAVSDRGGYRAIDVAKPEESEILKRIHSADDPMPPEDAEKPLTPKELDLFDQWIREGGQYANHWAFEIPKKQADVPEAGVIDAYVSKGLKKRGVDFAPRADRATLARRVSLVLTGFPPEPEQLREFLANESEDAYETLVDQLLASSRYGEHQARYWLDAVRYGDTHGLHLDNRRGIYPYRDWVVGAFNDNLPLDDFVRFQMAGDLLPEPTLSQRVATGFVRLNPSTAEGGAIPAEFQMKNNFDRVETMGTVFLGMTLTCARCHTHKYDPIPHQEYYRLLAFFNNTAEPAMDGNSYTYGTVAKAPDDQAAWGNWNRLEEERDQLLRQAAQVADLGKAVEIARTRSGWRSSNWRIHEPIASNSAAPKDWTKATGLPGTLSGRNARGKLPGADQEVWVSFEVNVPDAGHLLLTFSGASGSRVMVDRKNVPVFEKADQNRTAIVPMRFSKGKHQVHVVVRGGSGVSDLEVRIENPWDALGKAGSWDACSPNDRLRMLADAAGPLGDLPTQPGAERVAASIREAESKFTTTLVAQDLPKPRQTQVLNRGEYDQPIGETLQPGILSVMGEFPDAPRNRLGLAEWLTSPQHPTVSRVLINRVWQRTFGDGLVRTPEDFGLQGEQPTHPELLDWLAVELQESGWDLKHMLRLMVTSKTFCQSSAWRIDVDDPENRLLARAASYRLDAEVLRDVALWASGLLDPHMGGEGVKPYQPAGMWLAMAHPASNTKNYVPDSGQLLYRRSLYVYWKRTSPHPMMMLFDAPDRETSCVRRSRTNTSLQSLGLLNETQRVEMSRKLAERLVREQDNDTSRLNRLYQMLACRPPSDGERAACNSLLSNMRARFANADEDALALLSTGEAPRDDSLDAATVASWTQVAITVLASDAAMLAY